MFDNDLYIGDLKVAADHIVGLSNARKCTVLVTGATGMVGAYLVDTLLEADKEYGLDITVVACGRSINRLEKRFEHRTGDVRKLLKFMEYDMLEELPDSFDEICADYVIHDAGNAFPSAFVDHPEETVKGNIEGTARLLEYSKRQGVKRFVYISSGEVYSVSDDVRADFAKSLAKSSDAEVYSGKILEKVYEDGTRTCYPYSKVAAEELCLSEGKSVGAVEARLCHTFGPGASNADDRAHAQFARFAAAGENIVLNSAGTQLRSYNYIADAASGILSVMISGEDGESYDICSPDNVITIRGLADLMAEAAGVSVIVRDPEANEKRLSSPISRQVLNADKLCGLGWKKAFDLENGTRHYLGFLKNGF